MQKVQNTNQATKLGLMIGILYLFALDIEQKPIKICITRNDSDVRNVNSKKCNHKLAYNQIHRQVPEAFNIKERGLFSL